MAILNNAPMTPKTPKSAHHQSLESSASDVNDRFIPLRSNIDGDLLSYQMSAAENQQSENMEYNKSLADSLFMGKQESKILHFSSTAPSSKTLPEQNLRVIYSQNRMESIVRKSVMRNISSSSERTMDAPDLVDDYYLNLLSWGSNSVLAVGLGNSVCLWNSATGTVGSLTQLPGEQDMVTCVDWMPGSNVLAVGTHSAQVQLWDVERERLVRTMTGHMGRVGALSWNQHILSSGSADASIFNHDVRIGDHHIATLSGHTQEVCGLKWSPDGSQLASGGNDNMLHIWDAGRSQPKFALNHHQAAVKALAWCPWQPNLLASGGGTADRTLRMWNTSNGTCLNSIDTRSQVCSILWSPYEKEVLTSHGFSQNQLCLWKYPSLVKLHEFTGHTARVLHMALGPDGETVVSAGADQNLRVWRVFGRNIRSKDSAKAGRETAASVLSTLNIR